MTVYLKLFHGFARLKIQMGFTLTDWSLHWIDKAEIVLLLQLNLDEKIRKKFISFEFIFSMIDNVKQFISDNVMSTEISYNL